MALGIVTTLTACGGSTDSATSTDSNEDKKAEDSDASAFYITLVPYIRESCRESDSSRSCSEKVYHFRNNLSVN